MLARIIICFRDTESPQKLGIELRFDGTNRNITAIRAGIRIVEVCAAIEHIAAALIRPNALRGKAPDHRRQERRTVDHRTVDHLPLRGFFSVQYCGEHSECQHHAPAAEISDQVDWRCWLIPRTPNA